jgi:hypothetical protein
MDIRAHSEAAIGRVWNPEDHASLLAHLRRIDETVVAMHCKVPLPNSNEVMNAWLKTTTPNLDFFVR